MEDIRNVLFDYDGTIHNSIKIYAPSFKLAYKYLVKSKQAKEREFKDNEISSWLGYSSKDMWDKFIPHLLDNEKTKCSNIIGSAMIKYIEDGKASLYDGALDVLKYLKDKRYNLIFLSNCKIEYMNKNKEQFSLDKYFTDFYCTEQFDFIPKYKIFNLIKEKYKGDFVIIGDRYVDLEIAKIHNKPFIGCTYGYGNEQELEGSIRNIDNIKELITIL